MDSRVWSKKDVQITLPVHFAKYYFRVGIALNDFSSSLLLKFFYYDILFSYMYIVYK